ncbi:MAG: oxygenase MpaB family protein [Chloroflexi bacterium]|nr:oxygenase MpaB family protein [Chloroflexota bacterium]
MNIPTEYIVGHEKARLVDSDLADRYVTHTLIGDPVMDAVVEELSPLPQDQVHGFIQAGMHGEDMAQAPALLRAFFDTPPPDPAWLDQDAFLPGVYAFQRNSVPVLSAFVTGTLIDGFSTLIAKSFVQTGRIFDNGVWRLKQNNRHQMEIFWPGGLMPNGDGWRLSIRIRFVHAQVRRLLAQTEEWDHGAWGVPISAAHLGYAVSCFAARTIKHSEALGAQYTPEERAGFHAVWRYAGYLMGIPESILFADEDEALHLYRIGSLCEPPPSQESIIMTNALINSAPLVAGIGDREQREKLVNNVIYPVSRALIGNDLADELMFPSSRLPFALAMYRLDQRLQRFRTILKRQGHQSFATLLEASAYDDAGLSHYLPDHAHAERSRRW